MGRDEGEVKHARRGVHEWGQLVARWRNSGKTQWQWSKEHGVSYQSLRRWARRMRHEFVEVSPAARQACASEDIRIRAAGIEILLWAGIGEELLMRVVRAAARAGHVC